MSLQRESSPYRPREVVLASKESSLANELSFLFREDISVEDVTQREFGGATISVAVLTYSERHQGSNHGTHHKQTVLFLEDAELDLPEFSLFPRPKGLLGAALKLVGDFGTIEFDDSPEFAERYMLHAWKEDATRVFFNEAIRAHFATRPGWSVRGKKRGLAVFRKNHICDEAEIEEFAAEALEMMTLFQLGEEALDERPELSREAGPQDLLERAESMNGLAGSLIAGQLQKQLAKIRLTSTELSEFVQSQTPRTIPKGMRRQVLGDTFPLIIVGFAFIIAGIVAGTIWLLVASTWLKPLALGFYLMLPGIGSLMSFGTIRSRRNKIRALQKGELTEGKIKKVKKSSLEVNNTPQYTVSVEYEFADEKRTAETDVNDGDRARSLKQDGATVRLLVDPGNPESVVVLDLLTLFD
ncbi:MAG: DUF3592 domain-containing protein [Planctomycetota bacterium]